jgi:hypothetical protein
VASGSIRRIERRVRPMELVHEFTFTAVLNEAVPIGEGPFGNRRIREVLSGEVT